MKYIAVIFVFIIASCRPIKNENETFRADYPIKIDLTKGNNNQKISLSDITSTINYIKLETKKESYLANVISLHINDSNIYVKRRGRIFCFSPNGRFKHIVNKIGKGPGEGCARVFCVDPENNDLYMYENYTYRLMKYAKDGSFLSYFDTKHDGIHHVESIYYFKNKIIFGIRSYAGIQYFIKILDLKTNDISEMFRNYYKVNQEITNKSTGFDNKSILSDRIGDTLLFKEAFCDTIYYTTDLQNFTPRYIINIGKDKLSYQEDLLLRTFTIEPKAGDMLIQDYFCETSRFLFLRLARRDIVRRKGAIELAVYDKSKDMLFMNEKVEIINDIDGGPNFLTFSLLDRVWSHGDKIYCLVEAETIKNKWEENIAESKYQSKMFNELAQNISINDNPVIMEITLKKL